MPNFSLGVEIASKGAGKAWGDMGDSSMCEAERREKKRKRKS